MTYQAYLYEKCNCKHENNLVSSSSVDANNEDWTGWFFWKPGIGVATDHITSWWTVKPTARSWLSIFQTKSTMKITWMGKNIFLNSINRGLSISHYRKKGRFYRTNACTVFNSILSSTLTSTKLQLVKNFNDLSNLFSCDIC